MFKNIVVVFLIGLALMSCTKKKKNIVFYDVDQPAESTTKDSIPSTQEVLNDFEVEYSKDENTVSVPFDEKGGVKWIEVDVNGEFAVPMIIDSGCSTTLISIAEARYLYEKSCITQDDVLGITQAQIADGSIVNNMVINLRQIVIGGKIICNNVKATVSNNAQAPLLLGNEVLDRAPSYSVDNIKKQIIFKLQ